MTLNCSNLLLCFYNVWLDHNSYKIMWMKDYNCKVWYQILKIIFIFCPTHLHIHMMKYDQRMVCQIRKQITWHSAFGQLSHDIQMIQQRICMSLCSTYDHFTLFMMVMLILSLFVQNLSAQHFLMFRTVVLVLKLET